jgi:ribosomal protein S18 acetylase RimI-like enzyme
LKPPGAATVELRLKAFDPGCAKELVRMWRESFELGVGITDPHPIEEQERHLLDRVVPNHSVRVAFTAEEMVGFVAASPATISQLYVRKGFHRRGIGSRLVEWAKAQSGGSLWLYTFARNSGARAFYERHGFVAAAFGHEPDWDLDDVRYEWMSNADSR